MRTLIALICSSVAGGVGWWVGDFLGITAALILSVVASAYGWWYGAKMYRDYH